MKPLAALSLGEPGLVGRGAAPRPCGTSLTEAQGKAGLGSPSHHPPRRGNQGRGIWLLLKVGGACMLTTDSSPRACIGAGRRVLVQKASRGRGQGEGQDGEPISSQWLAQSTP